MRDARSLRSVTMLALGVGALALTACGTQVKLRHQFTGEAAVCSGTPFSQTLLRCLEHHEREGYRRVPE